MLHTKLKVMLEIGKEDKLNILQCIEVNQNSNVSSVLFLFSMILLAEKLCKRIVE